MYCQSGTGITQDIKLWWVEALRVHRVNYQPATNWSILIRNSYSSFLSLCLIVVQLKEWHLEEGFYWQLHSLVKNIFWESCFILWNDYICHLGIFLDRSVLKLVELWRQTFTDNFSHLLRIFADKLLEFVELFLPFLRKFRTGFSST